MDDVMGEEKAVREAIKSQLHRDKRRAEARVLLELFERWRR